jgi:hypothetical protein
VSATHGGLLLWQVLPYADYVQLATRIMWFQPHHPYLERISVHFVGIPVLDMRKQRFRGCSVDVRIVVALQLAEVILFIAWMQLTSQPCPRTKALELFSEQTALARYNEFHRFYCVHQFYIATIATRCASRRWVIQSGCRLLADLTPMHSYGWKKKTEASLQINFPQMPENLMKYRSYAKCRLALQHCCSRELPFFMCQ